MSVTEGGADSAEHLAYEVIRRLWPLHRTVVRAMERELAGTGLTAGQHALLDALRTQGPRAVPELARTLELDRQPVQRWVNHAAELGLVEPAPNPAHRRSPLIRLTPEGSEVMNSLRRSEAAGLRRVLAGVPAAEVATTLRVLDRLGEEFRALAQDEPTSPAPAPPETSRTPQTPREPQTPSPPQKPRAARAPRTPKAPRAPREPHPTPAPHTGRHGA
ncbi:MarR family transcriptional regulator [Streptomyces sp. NPDC059788]|uniref:MarR family winged helix-turn-helix transcriptional regulator n=1 Tax=Streptomyces sp. NPDC059788 TaxID=3346948 RepID=UPI00364A2FE3